MSTNNFQDTRLSISDGFDSYQENFRDTRLSISDGLDSYAVFQLSLEQMGQHNAESYFDIDDQEIQRLSMPTFADYGQNADTNSTQYESHHHYRDMKIIPFLTSSLMLPDQALHKDDRGMKSLSPPTCYGYSDGQAVDIASVQYDVHVQDDASVDVSEEHSIKEENQGSLTSRPFPPVNFQGSTLATCQDPGSSMTPSCQEDIHGVKELVYSDSQVQNYGYVAVDSLGMPPCQGDIQGVQEPGYTNSQVQYYGHVAVESSAMNLFQGDMQGLQHLECQGHQENEVRYMNAVDRVEAPASLNSEASIHQHRVDHRDIVPDGLQERSIGVSNLQHGSNLESMSRIKRSRHTQEDLLKLRSHYKDSSVGSSQNPNFMECINLSYGTNLDFKQVSTWFSNERGRERKRARERGDTEVIISTQRKRHSDYQITLLKAWVAKNNPTPTTKERKRLAQETGLSLEQVSGWFMTFRKNIRKAALREELSKDY